MWNLLPRWAQTTWRVLHTTSEEFTKDRCSLVAAALAFYTFLSVFPLLIVAVAIFAQLGPWSQRILDLLQEQVVQFAPGMAADVSREIRNIVQHSVSVLSIAFLGLLWSASRGFSTLQTALYAIWDLESRGPVRHLILNKLRALGLVVVSVVLLILSLAITSAVEALRVGAGFSFQLGPLPPLWESVAWAVSFLATVLMLLTAYVIVPSPKIRFRDLALAALLAAALWDLAKRGFALYVVRAAPSDAVYGSLGTAFLMLLWAYWSAAILLFGGELAQTLSIHARGELSAADD